MKIFKELSILLLLSVFCVQSTRSEEPDLYWTGEQLLSAVNTTMKELGHPEFSYDGLAVCLATQAELASGDEDVSERTTEFLKVFIGKKKFELPVRLIMDYETDLNLSDYVHSEKRLPLPPYWCLTLQILHINPLKSKDSQGQQMKVTWNSIQVASGLQEKGRTSASSQ